MTQTFNPPNISNATELVYDVETDGLDWKRNKIVGYVMTWGSRPDESAYFPTRHAQGDNFDHSQVTDWVKGLAKNPITLWTGHNMKFDLHMSRNEGIEFSGIVNCTMVDAALINENQGAYSLEACAKKYGVVEKKGNTLYQYMADLYGGKPTSKQMANFWKLSANDPIAIEYASGDGTSTWELWDKQREILNLTNGHPEDPSLRVIWQLECRVLNTLLRMERRGIRVNTDQLAWVQKTIQQRLDLARANLPDPNMNVKSNIAVERVMKDHGNIDADKWAKTPTGRMSFTEDDLEGHPLGQQIITVRKLRNLQASFLEGQISNHIFNGRVYTTFNQLKMDDYGTVTGRLSSSDPNLQQVPKHNKELAPIFRSIFMPDHGHYWSANDYKQQEYVVFAHYSGSKKLKEGYDQDPPIDMHSNVANLLSVERDPTAKRLNLGKLYGMGVLKLARSLGIKESEAKELSKAWDMMVPEARGFLRQAETKAKTRGYIYTLLGRRRRFPDPKIAYKAGNAVIQMCSADITKQKMVEIDDYFKSKGEDCQLLLQVHDELNWQVPVDKGDQDIEARRIMEQFGPDDAIHLRVRLRADHNEGDNWAIATFGEKVRDEIQREGV